MNNWKFAIALVCAIWFACTSFFWTYLVNVFISFPFGVIAFAIWLNQRKNPNTKKRYKAVATLLLAGTLASLAMLIALLISN